MSSFPSAPTQGDTYTIGDVLWVYDTGAWRIVTYDAADDGLVSGGTAGQGNNGGGGHQQGGNGAGGGGGGRGGGGGNGGSGIVILRYAV